MNVLSLRNTEEKQNSKYMKYLHFEHIQGYLAFSFASEISILGQD